MTTPTPPPQLLSRTPKLTKTVLMKWETRTMVAVRVSSVGRMVIGARIVRVFRPILVSTVVSQGIGQRIALLLLLQVRGNRRIVKSGNSEREREISKYFL
ncbi:hypothetical protein LguiA_019543 [Lonicera macranthoides]